MCGSAFSYEMEQAQSPFLVCLQAEPILLLKEVLQASHVVGVLPLLLALLPHFGFEVWGRPVSDAPPPLPPHVCLRQPFLPPPPNLGSTNPALDNFVACNFIPFFYLPS